MKPKHFALLLLSLLLASMMSAYSQNTDFRKYPYILLKDSTVTIMWQLYDTLNCTFTYEKNVNGTPSSHNVNGPFTDHLYKYEISNLEPGVLYLFEVDIINGDSMSGSFISPPASSANQLSFYGYGDTRGKEVGYSIYHDEVCKQIVSEITNDANSQTLLIHAGDWNYYDTEEMWDSQYFYKEDENAVELRTKIGVVGCKGNHEDDGTNYRKYWPYAYPSNAPSFWHSYDYGPIHFCFVDQRWPNYDLTDSLAQIAWIKNDLKTSTKPWKIMVFHPPVYTLEKDPELYNIEREFIDEICNDHEQYGVNMVLNGHEHQYSNWLVNSVHHLTLGGGGAPIGKSPYEPDEVLDMENPNIIGLHGQYHFAKFDMQGDYMKVTITYCTDKDNKIWSIYDEFIIPHSYIIKDGENIIWEDHGVHYYADNIRVEDGGSLTIKGDIEFQRDGSIIIEPGGKLTVDGALLTSLGNYKTYQETHWQGIQVWGNKSAHQYPDAYGNYQQGYLKLINGATIENALVAVDLWKPGNWSKTGGIVVAKGDNTEGNKITFRNNALSVHASHYNNFHPFDTLQEIDNMSYFKYCVFEINDDYKAAETFNKHVDLAFVKGIDFLSCNFLLEDNAEAVSEWNHAIAAYDAQFKVTALCGSQLYPCPENAFDKSSFTGFYSAVNATSDGSTENTFSINKAVFNNNAFGVKVHNVDNAAVLFSDFYVGYNSTPDRNACSDIPGTGIYTELASGFAYEGNNFTKQSGAPTANYFGVHINTTEAVDEIYDNSFSGLSAANYSEGKNWFEGDIFKGFAYFCNTNSDNYADFYVVDATPENPSGIQSFQGDTLHSTGNTFSQIGAYWHFYNGGEHKVDYYYCDNCSNETPDALKLENVKSYGIDIDNTCQAHYGGNERDLVLTASQLQDTEQEYYANMTYYLNTKSTYDGLVDGGNSTSLLQGVQGATTTDTIVLKNQLLAYSPYLSLEVLKAVANRSDIYGNTSLFDILSANPDELRKEELLTYLAEKTDPLPLNMLTQLRALAGGITQKTLLLQQLSTFNRYKVRAANDIIRSKLNDTTTNYTGLRTWLRTLGGISADRQIISTYLQQGDYTSALALNDSLSLKHDLTGDELTEHDYYSDLLDLYALLDGQGRNTYQLMGTEIATLELIAVNSNGTARGMARNILEAVYGHHYVNCPDLNGATVHKRGDTGSNTSLVEDDNGIIISVRPNPANQWVTFDYTLPKGIPTATLTIMDITGKTVDVIQLNSQDGHNTWDARHVEKGVYLYTIIANGQGKTGKIIISR